MDRRELSELIGQVPFQPFTIRMNNDSTYVITHADQIALTDEVAHVAWGTFFARLALSNMVEIEERVTTDK